MSKPDSIFNHILTPLESLAGVTALCFVVLLGLFVFSCAQTKPVVNADCTTDSECESMHPELVNQ